MPNIKGRITGLLSDFSFTTDGLMNYSKAGGYYGWSNGSAADVHFDFNTNVKYTEYIDNLNEVRVKSVISNGYIKLY